MRKKFFLTSVIVLFLLTGCSGNEENLINEKLDSEIEYVEDIIFKIANKHAKKEYYENDNINWNYIEDDVKMINDSWGTLVTDLTEVNIDNNEIMKCSDEINELLIACIEKQEANMVYDINKIYDELIIFKEKYSSDKNLISKMKIKSKSLYIYYLSYNGQYDEAQKYALELLSDYDKLMDNEEYSKENEYNLEKVYVLVQEYKKAVELENFDLIKLKYLNVVEKI